MRIKKKKHGAERLEACGEIVIKDLREQGSTSETLFGNSNPLRIEIGCGKGDFIVGTAAKEPDVNFLAIEKVSDVLMLAAEKVKKSELKNNIAKSIPSSPDLAEAVAMSAIVSKEMEEISSLTDTLSSLQIDTDTIDIDLKTKSAQYDKAIADEAKAEKAADETKKAGGTAAAGAGTAAAGTATGAAAGAAAAPGIVYKTDGSIDLDATVSGIKDAMLASMLGKITSAITSGGLGALAGLGGGDCGDRLVRVAEEPFHFLQTDAQHRLVDAFVLKFAETHFKERPRNLEPAGDVFDTDPFHGFVCNVRKHLLHEFSRNRLRNS